MLQIIEEKMTPENFCYWLQGFFELNSDIPPTKREQIIKDHLQTVFKKVTPTYTSTVADNKYFERDGGFAVPNTGTINPPGQFIC